MYNNWEYVKSFYYNEDGKVLGEIKKNDKGMWEAFSGSFRLGTYKDEASAAKAVEQENPHLFSGVTYPGTSPFNYTFTPPSCESEYDYTSSTMASAFAEDTNFPLDFGDSDLTYTISLSDKEEKPKKKKK
jgi:hypothetical protein